MTREDIAKLWACYQSTASLESFLNKAYVLHPERVHQHAPCHLVRLRHCRPPSLGALEQPYRLHPLPIIRRAERHLGT